MEWWPLIPILSVVFFATFVRSALGFGEALVAVPLLSLLMPVEVAAPLAVLISITSGGIIILQDRQHIHVGSAALLVISTLFGIPLGLLALTSVPEKIVKAVLGVVIITFSTYCLVSRRRIELKDDRLAWLFGFVAGILGGAYGMNGPPLVLYATFRRWSPEHFRATLQGYFLPASLLVMCGYLMAGLWVHDVTRYYLWSLPLALGAIVLGRAVNRRMNGQAFIVYVHAGLVLLGVILFAQSMRG